MCSKKLAFKLASLHSLGLFFDVFVTHSLCFIDG